uniref:PH domain-containing protein n=1 Tax=Strigamia maritima TaxID=126957 RepID=T1IJV0_STRMM
MLFYFEKKTDKEPIGLIILEGCTIEAAENEDQFSFKIVFHGNGGRSYIIGADTQENMEAWMKVLVCASYDYMKVMVAELQRQLDELTAAEKYKPVVPQKSRVRANPFDRRKSDESLANSAETQLCISSNVPCRPAPPPPSTYPPSQNESSAPDSNPTIIKKSFNELHEEYGRKIRAYLMKNGCASDALL